jgi:thioredoxin 1
MLPTFAALSWTCAKPFACAAIAEAEPLLRRALAIYEQQLGPVHPSTQKLRESVAELLEQLNLQEEPNLFPIGDQDFEEKVLKSPLPVLVFFWGAWSGPCRALSPVFEQVSTRYNGQLRFAKLDVDEHQTIPARFGIPAIPTLLVFEKGKVTYRFVGPHPSGLEDLIHRVLAHEDITEYRGGFFSPPPPFLD